MEFNQLMIDILVYVSCNFEMCIFKIAQFISENVRIAFLYVLSIESTHFNIRLSNTNKRNPHSEYRYTFVFTVYDTAYHLQFFPRDVQFATEAACKIVCYH